MNHISQLVPSILANHTPRSAEDMARDLHAKAESLRTTMWIMEANATFGLDADLRARWRKLGDEQARLYADIRALGFDPLADGDRWNSRDALGED